MKTKEEISAKIKNLKKQYLEAAKEEFKAQSDELFTAHPRLKSFSWQQYTPYFNDGDTCEFGVRNDEPKINGLDEYSDDGDEADGENLYLLARETTGYGTTEQKNPAYDRSAKPIIKAVQKFLKQFEEEYYKDAFGDHVEITVTRDGVSVEEYSHD